MKKKSTFHAYLILTFGTMLIAAGVYFFKFPNNFSTGGVSALSVLLAPVVTVLSAAQLMLIFNVLLLLVGLLIFGRGFAIKTIYCSLLLSFCTWALEIVFPMSSPFTDQKLLELIFAIGLTAAGSAILFNEGASSGGTDIVAMILKKYTRMDIGKALLVSDAILAVAAAFVFDIETGMFSVLGLMTKALVVDNVIESINLSKCFIIVTSKDEEICTYINQTLHRGATVSDCTGAFTQDDHKMIITVLNRGQAILLKRYIKQVDEKAFSIITNSSDILGRGFRTMM